MVTCNGVRHRESGFTLIELLIVVAIIGIIAAVALPAYQRYQVRTQANAALAEATALRTPVEAYVLGIGPQAVPTGDSVEVEILGEGEAEILATRPLGALTLSRSSAGSWACEHTFEIELIDCTGSDADAPDPGDSGDSGDNGDNGDNGDAPSTPSLQGCRNTSSESLQATCRDLYPDENFNW